MVVAVGGAFDLLTFTRASGGGRFNKHGLYEWLGNDQPRINHRGAKGLLVEPPVTNMFPNSHTLGAAGNILPNGANTEIAPDGTLTAHRVIENTANGEHYDNRGLSLTNGTVYTYSRFIKVAPGSAPRLYMHRIGATSVYLLFNPVTKTILPFGTAYINSGYKEYDDGFILVWMTFTAQVTGPHNILSQINNNAQVYTGDGKSGFIVWGGQVVTGYLPREYVPNPIVGTTTKAVDRCKITIANIPFWWNHNAFTILIDAEIPEALDASGGTQILFYGGVPGSNTVAIYRAAANGNTWSVTQAGGSQVAALMVGQIPSGRVKIAARFRTDDFRGSVNGGAIVSDSAGAMPTGITEFHIGTDVNGGAAWSSAIRRVILIPNALMNDNDLRTWSNLNDTNIFLEDKPNVPQMLAFDFIGGMFEQKQMGTHPIVRDAEWLCEYDVKPYDC